MAHELEIVNGKASMAYTNQVPWHGLGTKVDDNILPEEIMKVAGLDWKVEKHQTFIEIEGNKFDAGVDALVRTSDNKIFDTVGRDWNPVQNEEAFNFFCDFVEKGDMKMDTAGALKDGRIVWALAKLQSGFSLFNGDEVEGYLLFSNPHIWGKTIDIKFTPIRVVCNNTLTMALNKKGKNAVKINHRSKFDSERVKSILGISSEKMEEFKEVAEFLGSKKYKKIDLVKYYGEIFGISETEGKDLSRTGEQAMAAIETQPGAEFQAGTFWQVFNSVTYMSDHVLGRSADTRMESSWFGVNANRKQKALALAVEMAKKA